MARYYIYCDESIKKGKYYSNFYGGAMVNSNDYELIRDVLEEKRINLIQSSELKWQKIDKQNYLHYIDAIDTFFDFVQAGKVKVRIMFTDNRFTKPELSIEQRKNEYFLLYYQFLKHSFGLRFLSPNELNFLELYLDSIPDKKEKTRSLKITYMVFNIYLNLLRQTLRFKKII